MIYYEYYHISKFYNFNKKLNYIFNNMEHQTLVTLAAIHVTMTTPIHNTGINLVIIAFVKVGIHLRKNYP